MTAELVRRVVNPAMRRSPVVQTRRDRGARRGSSRVAGSVREARVRVAFAFAGSVRAVGAVGIGGTLGGVVTRTLRGVAVERSGMPFLMSSISLANAGLG